MPRIKLDRIDRKILRDLQSNGRMSNVNLAKNAGISAPPCLRRVRSLEEAGYIKGYFAKIDHHRLGYGITVFVQVKLDSQSDDSICAFEEKCNDWEMVRECCLVSGKDIDFLLRVVAEDTDSCSSFITKEIL